MPVFATSTSAVLNAGITTGMVTGAATVIATIQMPALTLEPQRTVAMELTTIATAPTTALIFLAQPTRIATLEQTAAPLTREMRVPA
jgi:hypothetical protein